MRELTELQKEILGVLYDWTAKDGNFVKTEDVIAEVQRRMLNKKSGMKT